MGICILPQICSHSRSCKTRYQGNYIIIGFTAIALLVASGKIWKGPWEQGWSLIKGAHDPFTIAYYINKTSLLDAALHFVLEENIPLAFISLLYKVIIFFPQHPTLVMFEEDDENNVYVSVSYPNLNFNISEPLTTGNRISGQERFYSVSTPIDIEVGIT